MELDVPQLVRAQNLAPEGLQFSECISVRISVLVPNRAGDDRIPGSHRLQEAPVCAVVAAVVRHFQHIGLERLGLGRVEQPASLGGLHVPRKQEAGSPEHQPRHDRVVVDVRIRPLDRRIRRRQYLQAAAPAQIVDLAGPGTESLGPGLLHQRQIGALGRGSVAVPRIQHLAGGQHPEHVNQAPDVILVGGVIPQSGSRVAAQET